LYASREYHATDKRCYNCGAADHLIRNCPEKLQNQKQFSGRGRGRAAQGRGTNLNHKAAAAVDDNEDDDGETAFAVGESTGTVDE
jgi:hypothetical protein